MAGSIYLGDGTVSSGTLTTTKSGGFITSGGTWTVEAWIYLTEYPSVGAYYVGAIVSTVNTSSQGWYFGVEGTTSSVYDTIELQNHDGTVGVYEPYEFCLNRWYHVAAVCVSGTIYFYVNGTVLAPAGSGTFSFTESNTLKVGYRAGPSVNYYLPARVSNIRIVNGTAVYTANFVPPKTSLPSIANTILLLDVLSAETYLTDSSPNKLAVTVNSGLPVYSGLTPYVLDIPTAPKVLNSAYGKGAGVTSITTSAITTTTGSTFIICNPSSIQNTPTDSYGNIYRLIGQSTTGGGFRVNVYICYSGLGGSGHTATSTYTGSGSRYVGFLELSAGSYLDSITTSVGSTSPFSVTSSPLINSNELALLFAIQDYTTSGDYRLEVTTGFSTLLNTSDNSGGYDGYLFAQKTLSNASAVTSSWTSTMSTMRDSAAVLITLYLPIKGQKKRNFITSDTFDTSISASWTNGPADFINGSWVSGGYVQPSSGSPEFQVTRNAETYNPDQYSKITVQALPAGNRVLWASVRGSLTTDESYCAIIYPDTSYNAYKYRIFRWQPASLSGTVTIAQSGTPSGLSVGDTITLEVQGSTLRMYTNESGSGDVLRLTGTDFTIPSGYPGFGGYGGSDVTQARVTSWEGGSLSLSPTLMKMYGTDGLAPLVNDNFDRVNESPIAGIWETVLNGGLNLVSYSTQAQTLTTGSPGNVSAIKKSYRTFTPDQYAKVKISNYNNGNEYMGPAVRWKSDGSGYMVQLNNYAIFRRDSSSWTNLGGSAPSFNSGDVLELRAQTLGSSVLLTVYVNSVLVSTYTDSSAQAIFSGQPGLFEWTDTGTPLTQMDNFEAGEIVPNGTVQIQNLVEVDAQIPNLLQTSGLYQSNAASGPITITMPQSFSKNSTAIMTLVNYDSGGSNRVASINVGGTLANRDMDSGSTPILCQIWRATNLTGDNTVVVTYTGGSTNYISISIEEWDKPLYLDRSNTITSQYTSTPTLSTPGASIASKGIAYAVYNETSGTTVTSSAPPTGWTETWQFVGGTSAMQGSGAYKVLSSNASVTATFTTGATSNYPEVMAVYALDTTNRYKFGAANNTLITTDDPNWQTLSTGFAYGTITTDGLGRGKTGTSGDNPGGFYQAPATGPVEQSSQIWMYPRSGPGGIRGPITQANSTSLGYNLKTYDGSSTGSGTNIELYKSNGAATYLTGNAAIAINLAASYSTVKMKTNILTKSVKVWVANNFVADAEVSGSLAINYTDPGTALLGGYPGIFISDLTSGNSTITNWTNFAPKYIVGNASPNFITTTSQPQGGGGQTYTYGGLQWFTAGYVSPITGSANTAYISINSAASVEIKVVVYDSSLSKVGEATFPNSLGTGLLSSKFDTPFSVVAGKTYYIAMSANTVYWGGYIGSGASWVCKGYDLTATGVIPTTLPVGAGNADSPEMSVYFTVDPAISYSKLYANGTYVTSQFIEQ